VLLQGQHYRSGAARSDRQRITLSADTRGHFVVDGTVNGSATRFLVDTGATAVVLPGADAVRMGIDYRKGERGFASTANGVAPMFRVKLNSVRLGEIELTNVDAMVVEQGLSVALLGMSFLNRVDMQREGQTMTLIRRF
jgi:aspartyl protease family protein